ncbi:MAG: hypothetical protein NZ699_07045 [Roseiflexus sp.]|nr:hypothetical protein [Roseiflexus sp.]MCS7288873.1 hypothetical protein [Roseiflexus sp.]MDW8144835.1 hypothetical protein [Roseiflexaceae bacterium]MDW8232256.1 hypothetical protein [Roseiflexaceae bacterium]
MRRWISIRIVLLLAVVFSLSGASAQARPAALPSTEPLTVLVDVEGAGRRVTGAYVIRRAMDSSGTVWWSFRGMLDGELEEVDGMAVERWSIDGSVTVELTAFNYPNFRLDELPAQRITLMPGWDGLVVIAGIPLAVKGEYRAPGAGSSPVIIVTNAGRGARTITRLPDTSDPPVKQGEQHQ